MWAERLNPPKVDHITRQRWFIPAVVCVLLGITLLVRLPGLRGRALWYDEAFSILFSRTGLKAMIEATMSTSAAGAAEEHPLLYYTLLWGWMKIFGSGVFAVRMLSVVISLVEVGLIWGFMKEAFSTQVALAAGLLFAFSPFQIQYGQEARMYGLLSLWVVLCAWMAWRGTTRPGWLSWLIFGVSAALAMYTHALAAVFLIPLGLTPFILKRPKRWRQMAVSALLAVVLYLPWGVHLPAQFAKVSSGFWIEKPGMASLLQTALGFITGLPLTGIALSAGLFLALVVYALTILQGLRQYRSESHGRLEAAWLLFLATAPVLLLFTISLWRPVFLQRVLLPAGAMLLLCLAWLWTAARVPRTGQALFLTALTTAFLIGYRAHLTYDGFPYAPFEQVADYVRHQWKQGDLILHANKISALPEAYYAPELDQRYLADPESSGSDTLAPATQRLLGMVAEEEIEQAVGNSGRVYFLVFEQELQDYAALGVPEHPGLSWLNAHFQLEDMISWGDLQMYDYKNPGPPATGESKPQGPAG